MPCRAVPLVSQCWVTMALIVQMPWLDSNSLRSLFGSPWRSSTWLRRWKYFFKSKTIELWLENIYDFLPMVLFLFLSHFLSLVFHICLISSLHLFRFYFALVSLPFHFCCRAQPPNMLSTSFSTSAWRLPQVSGPLAVTKLCVLMMHTTLSQRWTTLETTTMSGEMVVSDFK